MAGRSSGVLAALLSIVIASSSLVAFAEPTAAEKETARTLMKQGRTRRSSGDHKGALEAFAAADGLMRVPTTGYEVGKEQLDLGMLVEARDTFLRVSRIPEEKGEPPPFAEARTHAKQLASDIEARIPTLQLVLTVPAGADVRVTIDGKPLPKALFALPQRINAGPHEIVASAGAVVRKVNVDLAESETKDVAIDLTPTGNESVEAKPEAKPEATPPPPSDEKPPEKTGGSSPLLWIGFGVGGAGLIAGSVTGLLAASKTSKAKEQCDGNRCPPSTHDDLASARSMATISTISFIVAGVGIGVGVYGLVSRPGSKPAGTNVGPLKLVTPTIGLGIVGLSGRF